MRVLIPAVAIMGGVVFGVTTGLALRQAFANNHSSAAQNHPSQSPASGTSALLKKTAAVEPDDSPLSTQLARDLSMSPGVTRWLYWWDAIEKASPSDFPRLARLAQGNRAATRLVAVRWAELAPKQFFDTLRAAAKDGNKFSGDFATILFETWLKTDQAAAIAALNGDGTFPGRGEWRQQVATTLMATDPEAGLREMSQWHIENFGPNMDAVRKWAAADPRHAAEFTMANPAGFASQEAMRTIGETWAKVAPAQALDFAAAQPGELPRMLAQSALKSWAERDLTSAADWLANSDPSTLKTFSPAFVEAWAKQDAPSALGWCEANLTGSTLTEAVQGVFNGASQKDVASAAALVTSMAASPARAQAAAAVAQKWFPDTFANKPVPPETLAWVTSLDPDSIRRVVEAVSWKWTDSDPSSLAAFLQSATNISFPTYTYNNLARAMARNDPASALDWAGRLPEGLALAAGSTAFGEWGRSQSDAAMQWFSQLPASDPRRQPFLSGLLQQLAWDPQAGDRFAQVAAADPSTARSVLQGMAISTDRRAALLARLSP